MFIFFFVRYFFERSVIIINYLEHRAREPTLNQPRLRARYACNILARRPRPLFVRPNARKGSTVVRRRRARVWGQVNKRRTPVTVPVRNCTWPSPISRRRVTRHGQCDVTSDTIDKRTAPGTRARRVDHSAGTPVLFGRLGSLRRFPTRLCACRPTADRRAGNKTRVRVYRQSNYPIIPPRQYNDPAL